MALYNIIDTFWVARLGHEAIAALTVVLPFTGLVLAFGAGTGVGISSLVSRRFGEGDVEATNHIAGQIFPLTVFFGSILLILVGFFAEPILRLCGATPDIMDFALQYITVIGFGLPVVFFAMVATELLRGSGDALKPMIFMVTASVINMVLDPFLIFGWWIFPEMGIGGAALATIISQGVGGGLGFIYLVARKSTYRIRLSHIRPDFSIIRDIYRVGLPSMLVEFSEAVCFLLMNNVLSGFGSLAIAGVGLIIRVIDFAFMPIIGVAHGLLPIVGYNFGARNWKRMWGALRIAVVWLVGLMGAATILMEIFAPQLIGIFNQEQELMELAVPAMRIAISSLAVMCQTILFIVTFQAIGKGKAVLLLSLARQFLFFVPFMYGLSNLLGLRGVWISWPISDVCGYLVAGSWLWREYRRMKKTSGWRDLPSGQAEG